MAPNAAQDFCSIPQVSAWLRSAEVLDPLVESRLRNVMTLHAERKTRVHNWPMEQFLVSVHGRCKTASNLSRRSTTPSFVIGLRCHVLSSKRGCASRTSVESTHGWRGRFTSSPHPPQFWTRNRLLPGSGPPSVSMRKCAGAFFLQSCGRLQEVTPAKSRWNQ